MGASTHVPAGWGSLSENPYAWAPSRPASPSRHTPVLREDFLRSRSGRSPTTQAQRTGVVKEIEEYLVAAIMVPDVELETVSKSEKPS